MLGVGEQKKLDPYLGDGDLRAVPVHKSFGQILLTSEHSGKIGQPKYNHC